MLAVGWGGYLTSVSLAQQIIDKIHAEGRTLIRYWAHPNWASVYTDHNKDFNKAIADALVERANQYDMDVLLDFNHYLPEDFHIMTTSVDNSTAWINNAVTIGSYYKNNSNVILEPICEDSSPSLVGWSTFKPKLNALLSALRAAGINNRVIIDWGWTSWGWPSGLETLNDSNYGLARHLYLSSPWDAIPQSTPTTLESMKNRVLVSGSSTTTLQSMMNNYFYNFNNVYVQGAKHLTPPPPLGFWIDGSGPSAASGSPYLITPTPTGLAYVMLMIRECIANNVPFCTYRFGPGTEDVMNTYQNLAIQYFGETMFPSSKPQGKWVFNHWQDGDINPIKTINL